MISQRKVKWELNRFEVVGKIQANSDGEAEELFQEQFFMTPLANTLIDSGWALGDCVSTQLDKVIENGGSLIEFEITLCFV